MTALATGLLSISIDLESRRDQKISLAAREQVSRNLIKAVAAANVPATWIIAEPAIAPVVESLMTQNAGHELALLGEREWIGHEASRATFHRELSRRIGDAQAKGIAISTLALRDARLGPRVDLAMKLGIRCVLGEAESRNGALRRPTDGAAHWVRFGLWEFSVTDRLPGPGRWSWWTGRGIRRALDRAIAARAFYHLTIDAALLAERGSGGFRALEAVLRHAARRRAAGVLTVTTLAAAGEILAARAAHDRRGVSAAQSILRGAA